MAVETKGLENSECVLKEEGVEKRERELDVTEMTRAVEVAQATCQTSDDVSKRNKKEKKK